MSKHEEITAYRPCVGVMLINKAGLVWIGRRFDKQNDEGKGHWWQMPQGGIDKGEDVPTAALRELAEETAVTSAEIIAESSRWYNYDLPEHLIGKSWNGKYRGQTQKWVALRFTGAPVDLVVTGVARHPLGHAPDQALTFARMADGAFVSDKAVARGRWLVRLTAQAGKTKWREELELR